MHWGYADGEEPHYAVCECGQRIRVDRLDLILEHAKSCKAKEEPRADH